MLIGHFWCKMGVRYVSLLVLYSLVFLVSRCPCLAFHFQASCRPNPGLTAIQRQVHPSRSQTRRLNAGSLVDSVWSWSKVQTLEGVVPRAEASVVLKEVGANVDWKAQYVRYEKLFDRLDAQIRKEKRSIEVILGANTTRTLLGFAERIGPELLDPASVNAFLRQPAFEEIIGSVIYEAIFTFIERVDILGNIVNGLPIIGPIRKQINDQIKRSLDETLGRQIKGFLVDYNRVAIARIADFALSPSNRAKFGSANKALLTSLLRRPASSFLPAAAETLKLKTRLWDLLLDGLRSSEGGELLDQLYEAAGGEGGGEGVGVGVGELVDFDALLAAAPALRGLLDRNFDRLLASEQGREMVRIASARLMSQ